MDVSIEESIGICGLDDVVASFDSSKICSSSSIRVEVRVLFCCGAYSSSSLDRTVASGMESLEEDVSWFSITYQLISISNRQFLFSFSFIEYFIFLFLAVN